MLDERIALSARRVVAVFPLLIGVSIVTFLILNVLPGSAAQQLLGPDALPEDVARLEADLGLGDPLWQQYWVWIRAVLSGDWGTSLASGQPVGDMLDGRIFVTLELAAVAVALSIVIAIALAVAGAIRPGQVADKVILFLSMALLSMPSYSVALLLALIFAVYLDLFPSIGFTPFSEDPVQHFRSMALPVASIALPLIGLYSRFLRDDIVDQLNTEDYVLTAKGKGLSRRQVIMNHTLRNAAPGLLALAGLHFGTVVGGTVIVEQIFGIPGLGHLLFLATNTRDVPVVQAIVLLLAAITVLMNLIIDLLCSAADPRIDLGAAR